MSIFSRFQDVNISRLWDTTCTYFFSGCIRSQLLRLGACVVTADAPAHVCNSIFPRFQDVNMSRIWYTTCTYFLSGCIRSHLLFLAACVATADAPAHGCDSMHVRLIHILSVSVRGSIAPPVSWAQPPRNDGARFHQFGLAATSFRHRDQGQRPPGMASQRRR